ncbi:hypothetical protein CHLRE_16g689201v5 [Chlamydomonas reinhardtii]|uniref:Uncharacterized protein n=1 Tax=Chlamydomonas reinhardtii TaxID=3055 RepID=A0A2K3CU54_CHLRE|nr:uncharacterized protein CHLRE_16g689201v5 [Chlamydomonas reinhardtii]PNW71813.1 hypothetical protein CHLRE_16g689201v5 [Chlamydomonas reinhardtii]
MGGARPPASCARSSTSVPSTCTRRGAGSPGWPSVRAWRGCSSGCGRHCWRPPRRWWMAWTMPTTCAASTSSSSW